MTEMTKKVKSRTWEQLPEVYGLAVILVICVIGGMAYILINHSSMKYHEMDQISSSITNTYIFRLK